VDEIGQALEELLLRRFREVGEDELLGEEAGQG